MKTNNYFRIFIQRIIILAIIGLTVWLYGCKKESNSSNFVYPNFIDPNLFGTWRSNGNDVLAFKDNNVFLDSFTLEIVDHR